MTENEAIEALRLINTSRVHPFYSWEEMAEVRDIAISALKEVQQYREIGTVEQMKNQKENLSVAYRIISDYESIGTVEECREAVEKQKPKKPKELDTEYEYFICGNCGGAIACTDDFKSHKYCLNCGQAINWEESEDNIMMDAVKYLKERERMCNSYSNMYSNMCDGCGFGKAPKCNRTEGDNPEKAVEIVEKWSAEHPIKTRQSEFLKMFPNADIQNDVIRICPKKLDQNSVTSEECSRSGCFECRKKYWLEEVE